MSDLLPLGAALFCQAITAGLLALLQPSAPVAFGGPVVVGFTVYVIGEVWLRRREHRNPD